jgi:hypothetical protein
MAALIDLNAVEGAFDFEAGFSRPNWPVISQTIEQTVADPDDRPAAWSEAARQWVTQVQSDLGGNYRIHESRRFILLTELDDGGSANMLTFAEQAASRIREWLGEAAWDFRSGKHVVILFSDQDDYYQYLSYFCRDGLHPASGGCLLHKGYVHIAAPYHKGACQGMLAHELVHNYVAHLRLPLWLNEGLATTFERSAAGRTNLLQDPDLQPRHMDFWNAQTIQEFWCGLSFQKPGDSNELSYSLAEIIVTLLREKTGSLPAFIKHSDRRDAGQTSAIECLGLDLGEVAATFLGQGDWRPRRKAMAELWQAANKKVEDG